MPNLAQTLFLQEMQKRQQNEAVRRAEEQQRYMRQRDWWQQATKGFETAEQARANRAQEQIKAAQVMGQMAQAQGRPTPAYQTPRLTEAAGMGYQAADIAAEQAARKATAEAAAAQLEHQRGLEMKGFEERGRRQTEMEKQMETTAREVYKADMDYKIAKLRNDWEKSKWETEENLRIRGEARDALKELRDQASQAAKEAATLWATHHVHKWAGLRSKAIEIAKEGNRLLQTDAAPPEILKTAKRLNDGLQVIMGTLQEGETGGAEMPAESIPPMPMRPPGQGGATTPAGPATGESRARRRIRELREQERGTR